MTLENYIPVVLAMEGRSRPSGLPLMPTISHGGGLWLKENATEDTTQDQQEQQYGTLRQYDLLDARDQQRPQTFIYHANTSSSDLVTPITPTFSHRGTDSHHLRYSSSASSLDLFPTISACSEIPRSPSPVSYVHTTLAAPAVPIAPPTTLSSAIKSPLPDVAEEPLDHDEIEQGEVAESEVYEPEPSSFTEGLYDCLCDSPCLHRNAGAMPTIDWATDYTPWDHVLDCDVDCFSDSEAERKSRSRAQSRTSMDSTLNGLGSKLNSKMQTLQRWRSTRRRNRAMTANSDSAFDFSPAFSRATSASRSSSLSPPSRRAPDRSFEPPLPPTPALSMYDVAEQGDESLIMDLSDSQVRHSIEKDRTLATTPLLPPLLTEVYASKPQSVQPSPLQSPTIVTSPVGDLPSPTMPGRQSLSTRPSISFARPPLTTSMSAPIVGTTDVHISIPNILEQGDEWSDRLGHANFTIHPKPYDPVEVELSRLDTFRGDWDQARISYTKHLVRTGEHYGLTSKIYGLTEDKWTETEQAWRTAHQDLLSRLVAASLLDSAIANDLQRARIQDESPSVVPTMLDAAEAGKFPSLGDEDIVGPMERDAVMVRDEVTGAGLLAAPAGEDGKGASKFWKNLVEKVGLRK